VALVKALGDREAVRRVAAAEVLAAAGGAAHPAVRKLLTDADPQVRLQVALALVNALDREAVPALIELVADLPQEQAWEADDVLRRLAGEKAPKRTPAGDAAARKELRTAWRDWWKAQGADVNLALLHAEASGPGLIVVAELGPKGTAGGIRKGFGPGGFNPPVNPPVNPGGGKGGKGGKGGGMGGALAVQAGGGNDGPAVRLPADLPANGSDRIVAFDRKGQVAWQIENLDHPKDFQLLPNGRVLVAEYYANRVTERDLKGNILWEVNTPAPPMNVQRLANGNTFVALYGSIKVANGYYFLEVDRQGNTVATYKGANALAAGGMRLSNPRAGFKMADGRMVCLAVGGTCVWLDATGKEGKQFAVQLQPFGGGVTSSVGNIDVTARGHLIVAQAANVAEYDPDGKIVWQADVAGNRATRLASGNTLVASENAGVFEVDAAGRIVWQYQPAAGYQAVRARQSGNAPGK
jgi:hypothetical protein